MKPEDLGARAARARPGAHEGGAAVLDLLDEVPEEQGPNPFVTAFEERASVVEDHLEQRSEGGLQVGDVGEVEVQRLALEKLVVGGCHRGEGVGELR